jgi:hypothetical protein
LFRDIQPYPKLPAACFALKPVIGTPAGFLFDSFDKGPVFALAAGGAAGKADHLSAAQTLKSGSGNVLDIGDVIPYLALAFSASKKGNFGMGHSLIPLIINFPQKKPLGRRGRAGQGPVAGLNHFP